MFQNINPNDVLKIFCLRELRSLEDKMMTSLEISSENSEIVTLERFLNALKKTSVLRFFQDVHFHRFSSSRCGEKLSWLQTLKYLHMVWYVSSLNIFMLLQKYTNRVVLKFTIL